MYFVYALYNKRHSKIYIGQTSYLEGRIKLHNDSTFKNNYTSRFDGSWKLIYSEQMRSRNDALRREKELKSHQGRDFVWKIV